MHHISQHSFEVPGKGTSSALLCRPEKARCLYLFAHGAGAGMTHTFMETICQKLADKGIATLRYQFLYMQAGKKRPDHRNTLIPTVLAALNLAHQLRGDLALFAGGKSMGGRMTSMTLSEHCDDQVRGLVFFGFPLHATGKPGTERATHLEGVKQPMLFLQGTRDTLADLTLLKPICDQLVKATIHIEDGADHSFKVLKRSGLDPEAVLDSIVDAMSTWIAAHLK